MGAPAPQSTGKMLKAYAQYLPSVLEATAPTATPIAQSNLAATQATEPGMQQLNAELTQEFAPLLAQINSNVQRQQAMSGSGTVGSEIAGPGGAAAGAARSLLDTTNPEYSKTIGTTSDAAQKLIGSYNLSGLTPGEANAAERSTNQTSTATGNLGLNNPMNTINNAMNFGQAFDAKRAAMNTAIGTGNQTAGLAASAFNPVGIATAQPGTSGLTQFGQTGTGASATQGAMGFGQGLLGNMTGLNNAATSVAGQQSVANSVPAYMSSMPSYS